MLQPVGVTSLVLHLLLASSLIFSVHHLPSCSATTFISDGTVLAGFNNWTLSGSPYVLSGTVFVGSGATLVRFMSSIFLAPSALSLWPTCRVLGCSSWGYHSNDLRSFESNLINREW